MHRFLTLLQKDLRYFLYLEGLLMLFRVAFLVLFRSQLNAFPLQKSSMPFILAFASVLRRRSFLWGFLFFWQPYREASLPAIRKKP